MLLGFTRWLQSLALFTYIRESAYIFPIVLSLHMVLILFFGGMILMTNMCILGLALRGYPLASVIGRLRIPKRIGLLCMLTMGFLLFGSKAVEYSQNVFFRIKIALLIS